tara:strand:+ start:76 stop:297 length:222 start_codon:yes stop_codon:yes gene_type:complete
MELCIKCSDEIPAGRLKALPDTKVCISCSTAGRKKAITITGGKGEDTYNDIVLVSEEDYKEYTKDEVRKNTLD